MDQAAAVSKFFNNFDQIYFILQASNDGAKKRKRSESPIDDTNVAGTSNEPNLMPSIKPSDSLNGDILWIQVQLLRERFPNRDPNVWYARLENAADIVAESEKIIQELKGFQTGAFGGGDAGPSTNEPMAEPVVDADFIGTLLEDPEIVQNQPVDEVVELVSLIVIFLISNYVFIYV